MRVRTEAAIQQLNAKRALCEQCHRLELRGTGGAHDELEPLDRPPPVLGVYPAEVITHYRCRRCANTWFHLLDRRHGESSWWLQEP